MEAVSLGPAKSGVLAAWEPRRVRRRIESECSESEESDGDGDSDGDSDGDGDGDSDGDSDSRGGGSKWETNAVSGTRSRTLLFSWARGFGTARCGGAGGMIWSRHRGRRVWGVWRWRLASPCTRHALARNVCSVGKADLPDQGGRALATGRDRDGDGAGDGGRDGGGQWCSAWQRGEGVRQMPGHVPYHPGRAARHVTGGARGLQLAGWRCGGMHT